MNLSSRLFLIPLFICLICPLFAQKIVHHPEGLITRHSHVNITKTVEFEGLGVTMYASEYTSDWEILKSYEFVRHMIESLADPDHRAAFDGFEVYLVTEGEAPMTRRQMRGTASSVFVMLNASSACRWQQSVYNWKPGAKSSYRGWAVHAHETGHSIENRLELRTFTKAAYADSGRNLNYLGEFFAWDTENWFGARVSSRTVAEVRDGWPSYKRDYYASIFDPADLWGPDNSTRPVPANKHSVPHPTPMIPDYNFAAILGRYEVANSSNKKKKGNFSALEYDSAQNPTKIRWTNDAGESWDYAPDYDSQFSQWVLRYIKGSIRNSAGSSPRSVEPVHRWESEPSAYRIAGVRMSEFFRRVPAGADPLPFPDPKIVLFRDNFERSDSFQLNASSQGKSGELGLLDYTGRTTQSGTAIRVHNKSLFVRGTSSPGGEGGLVHLSDHNFVDSAIQRSGQLLISADISSNSSANTPDQWVGFSVGQSLSDLENLTTLSPEASPADLLIAYQPGTGQVRVYKNGTLIDAETKFRETPSSAAKVTLHLRHVDSFSSGKPVSYEVYFDDDHYATAFGEFEWSGKNENHICLHSTLSSGVRFDNFEISTFATPGITLFSDNFNRSDTADPNISLAGKTGLLVDQALTVSACTSCGYGAAAAPALDETLEDEHSGYQCGGCADHDLALDAILEPAEEEILPTCPKCGEIAADQADTLSGPTYSIRSVQGGNSFRIVNNRLQQNSSQSSAESGSILYINNQNFIDSEIIQHGGFEVAVDLADSTTTGFRRQLALGIGQSLSELDALQSADPADSPADLGIAYRPTTRELEIYNRGTLNDKETSRRTIPEGYTRLRVKVLLTDGGFAAGSLAHYQVFFGLNSREPFMDGTFTWSGTNQNYISLSSNLTGASSFDNLFVKTLDGIGSLHAKRALTGLSPKRTEKPLSSQAKILRQAFQLDSNGTDTQGHLPVPTKGKFTFARFKGGATGAGGTYDIDNIRYRIQTSVSLKENSWREDTSHYTLRTEPDPNNPYMERVVVTPTSPNAKKFFFRVVVEEN